MDDLITTAAAIARNEKQKFIDARRAGADYDTLAKLAKNYTNAIRNWHKLAYPNKKFTAPSVGYLIRAL